MRFGTLFHVFEDLVHLEPDLRTPADRTAAVADALAALAEDGLTERLRGEMYPVIERLGAEPLFDMDRGAVTAFGIANRGFHLTGLVGAGHPTRLRTARRPGRKSAAQGTSAPVR